MAKVKMLRQPRGHYNAKAFPAVGEVAEFDADVARALVHFKYAEAVSDEKPAEAPGETPESETADSRETRTVEAPEKRGHNKPRN